MLNTSTASFSARALCCLLLIGCSAARPKDEIYIIDAPPAEKPTGPPETLPHQSQPRNRRSVSCGTETTLTVAQQLEAVRAHNALRAKEPAGDILKMAWDNNLAAQAQALVNQCVWQHGMQTDCDGNAVGQNMFIGIGATTYPAFNLTNTVSRWNDERQNWDFSSGQCAAGKVCGHWTQVAWSTSTLVGCGFAQCPLVNVSGTMVKNVVLVACNYSPSGNVVGKSLFTAGSSCSACWKVTRQQTSNRGFKCVDNLCVPCSPASDDSCGCGPAENCQNGGTWSSSACACQCVGGFFGSSCQTKCADVASKLSCATWLGNGYCSPNSPLISYMKTNCVATCNLCF